MKSSNIFHEIRLTLQRPLRWLLGGLALACLTIPAHPLNPGKAMSQYIYDSWGAENGFPGGTVRCILQTTDGYLWIGSEEGLVRYDGQQFRLIQPSGGAPPVKNILGMATDGGTGLWLWLTNSSILHYSDGRFENGADPRLADVSSISAMYTGNNGGYLLATFQGRILSVDKQKIEDLISDSEESHLLIISLAKAPDGRVWGGTRDLGLFYLKDGHPSFVNKGLPDTKINSLLPVANHEVWVGTDNGVARWNGTELTTKNVPAGLGHVQALAMIEDRDSNIWIGTSAGLFRTSPDGAAAAKKPGDSPIGTVSVLFEDREGNLWIGGSGGVARLRDSVFTTYSTSDGLPSNRSGPVYGDSSGRTWFAPAEGGLYSLQNGKVKPVTEAGFSKDIVYSITGSKGELWVGRQIGGLTHLHTQGDTLVSQTYTHADGLAQDSVYAVHKGRDGTVWAGTLSSGVSAFRDGKFTTFTVSRGLLSNTIAAIEDSPDGTTWFATPNGLSALSNGHWRSYTDRDGLPSNNVNCLLNDSGNVLWVGTTNGLAFVSSGRAQTPRTSLDPLRKTIVGLAEDKSGWLWISTTNSVLRVNREKLLSGTLTDSDVREYGIGDGLLSVEGIRRDRSVSADPQGRIWFSMSRGLSVADPARMTGSAATALVHIEGLSADGTPIDLQGTPRVPGGRQRIAFNYSGLSLSMPARVRFRYMLDGFDRSWSEPVAAREAAYTNLGPGIYQFRVMATNSDGQWNGSEATLRFQIEPAIWQTWWFRLLCLLGLGCVALALYQLRLHALTKQLNMRFEERLAERTRIAQELHDTLLQGCLSASMQLHVAFDRLPADSPAKPLLGRVLQLMGQVVDEGRNALMGLRSRDASSDDLEQAFSRIAQELGIHDEIAYRVILNGEPRSLHPVIRDEAYRIGREALVNAFRHSEANHIEVELEYASSHLLVLVRDDGRGIDRQVLRLGREGHWGLSGMRERAERLGAKLKISQRLVGGTEVELIVPGAIAYKSQGSGQQPKQQTKLDTTETELPQSKR